ncbi:hypothetical protein [Roseomonas populi]|uniref:Uncharacterized protein n=1 Tax=Roseomonas populi TaxID=3121582 RepID=A0ABT1WZ42_9PROT|nr:hypothetical protein [Roseomonas pecuniae]MCR0980806.1 hypothetical protein [Roseomonas pecuniae]
MSDKVGSKALESLMSQFGGRTPEAMLAELVHHMAAMTKEQKDTNALLQQLIQKLGGK